jgi:hypothetical protein
LVTYSETYGTYSSLVVTSLASMAASATAGWQSARVDNTSEKAQDYEIHVKLPMANTAPGGGKQVTVYISAATYDGSTWFQSDQGTATLPTGTQGTTTIAVPNDLVILDTLPYTTQNMTLQRTMRLSSVFGYAAMPMGFSIIIIDDTGAAIGASPVVGVVPIHATSV